MLIFAPKTSPLSKGDHIDIATKTSTPSESQSYPRSPPWEPAASTSRRIARTTRHTRTPTAITLSGSQTVAETTTARDVRILALLDCGPPTKTRTHSPTVRNTNWRVRCPLRVTRKLAATMTSMPSQMTGAGMSSLVQPLFTEPSLTRASASGASAKGTRMTRPNCPKTADHAATKTWLTPPNTICEIDAATVPVNTMKSCSGPPSGTAWRISAPDASWAEKSSHFELSSATGWLMK